MFVVSAKSRGKLKCTKKGIEQRKSSTSNWQRIFSNYHKFWNELSMLPCPHQSFIRSSIHSLFEGIEKRCLKFLKSFSFQSGVLLVFFFALRSAFSGFNLFKPYINCWSESLINVWLNKRFITFSISNKKRTFHVRANQLVSIDTGKLEHINTNLYAAIPSPHPPAIWNCTYKLWT